MSPSQRYRFYPDLATLLHDIRGRGYQVIGFRRITKNDWYLDAPSSPEKPLIRQWPYPEDHLSQYLILKRIN